MESRNPIKILSKCRIMLKFMNLCQKPEFHFKNWKISNWIIFIILSIPLCYSIVMESMTIYEIGLNFKEAASGFLILLGTIQIVLIYFCLANDNGEIIKMVNEIEQIVNQRSRDYHQSYEIYQAIERKNDIFNDKARKLRIVFLIGAYGPSAMYPIFYALFGSPSPDQWKLSLPMKIFHETFTTFGFYAGLLEQFVITFNYAFWVFAFILFYIGLCSYVDALIADMKAQILELNRNCSTNSKRCTRLQIDTVLKEIIELHNIILRFLKNIRFIMSGPLFYELSSIIIGTVCELLALDQIYQEKKIDSSAFVSANGLMIHVSTVYILCLYAEQLTTQTIELIKLFYCDLLWYNLSINQQKCMILIICRSQTNFRMTGYGIYNCSMELFLTIIRLSISYFIVMRQLKA